MPPSDMLRGRPKSNVPLGWAITPSGNLPPFLKEEEEKERIKFENSCHLIVFFFSAVVFDGFVRFTTLSPSHQI